MSCTKCGVGKFQDGVGATTCEDCPSGRAQPGAGADKCDECQVISFFSTMALTVVPDFPIYARHSVTHHNATQAQTVKVLSSTCSPTAHAAKVSQGAQALNLALSQASSPSDSPVAWPCVIFSSPFCPAHHRLALFSTFNHDPESLGTTVPLQLTRIQVAMAA